MVAAMGKQFMTITTFETRIEKLRTWLRRQNSEMLPRYRAACKTERSLGQFLHKLQGAYKKGGISTDMLEILETIPQMQLRLQRWRICDSLSNKVKMGNNTVRREHKHFDHDVINGQANNATEDLQSRKELRIATRLDELHQWMVRNKMRLPSSVSAELQEQRQHNFLRKELYSRYIHGNLPSSIINHMRAIPEVQRLIARWDKIRGRTSMVNAKIGGGQKGMQTPVLAQQTKSKPSINAKKRIGKKSTCRDQSVSSTRRLPRNVDGL